MVALEEVVTVEIMKEDIMMEIWEVGQVAYNGQKTEEIWGPVEIGGPRRGDRGGNKGEVGGGGNEGSGQGERKGRCSKNQGHEERLRKERGRSERYVLEGKMKDLVGEDKKKNVEKIEGRGTPRRRQRKTRRVLGRRIK